MNMVKFSYNVILCAVFLFSLQAKADSEAPMPTFTVNYTVENKYITGGVATFRLAKSDNNSYQLLLRTDPTGMFRFSDKGKTRELAELPDVTPPFLASQYTYTNYGDENRSYVSTYDRANGDATITQSGNSESFNIESEAVDRLSMTLAVMHQLRSNNSEKFTLKTINRQTSEIVEFTPKGQATIKTNLGKLQAIRVDRQRPNSSRSTITWFANLGDSNIPIPVQIEQHKRGKLSVRLRITSYTIDE